VFDPHGAGPLGEVNKPRRYIARRTWRAILSYPWAKVKENLVGDGVTFFTPNCLDFMPRNAHDESAIATDAIDAKGMIAMTKTITPAELAVELGTDPKTARKFLRSTDGLDRKVGKGHRWAIESREVRGLKSRFGKWEAKRREEIARRAAERAEDARNAATDAENDEDEVEDLETVED